MSIWIGGLRDWRKASAKSISFVANGDWVPVLVDCDVDDFGFGDSSSLAGVLRAIGFDCYFDRDRGVSYSNQIGVEAHKIADEDWSYERDLVHCFGDDFLERVLADFHCCREVDIAEDDSAEYGPLRVRVFRHQHHANGRLCGRLVRWERSVRITHRVTG